MVEHRVVIVGAGPAGLAAAITLARVGIDVLVLERRVGTSPLPRATVLSLRSMELLRSWGLADRVLAGADDVEMTMRETPTLARVAEGATIDVGYPSAQQSAVLSPTRAACVAQDHLEAVLLEELASLRTARLERGVEVVGVEPAASGVRLTIRDHTAQRRTLRTAYLIGADGARSTVRTALGIPVRSSGATVAGARIEFRAPLWDLLGEHRHLLYAVTAPSAEGVLLPAGLGDRWIFAVTAQPGRDLPGNPTVADLRRRLQRAIDVPGLDPRITRHDRFSSRGELAERFSHGRVHLAGDAAHRVTPRGGTGLNIALADGYDLGWKLGWVLRGLAGRSLMSSYEPERRPAVRHNLERSVDPSGARRTAPLEVPVDLSGRIKHLWVAPGVSTLDLLDDGFSLLTADPPAWRRTLGRPAVAAPVSVTGVSVLNARSLGLGPRGAVLLRPDGVPVAAWSTSPSAGLVQQAAAAFLDHGASGGAGSAA
ncbi:FAD-dependent monooxygenase [Kineosporia sp. A_224]|uniref:FAD-dependent monooxygenase n=1 Tax=Kineosporia sp. A_224 TaxID=1962180 RepID=UPI0013046904|nr:FAD-dependent monooxygenase [Kineosporia sp. A_224]